MITGRNDMENKIESLPMVALRGMTVLPEMVVHFDVSRKKSLRAVEQAMEEKHQLFLTAQKSSDTEDPGVEDVFEMGCIVAIKQIVRMPKKISRVLILATKKAIEAAKRAGALLSFDPNLRPPLWKSLDTAKEKIAYGDRKSVV